MSADFPLSLTVRAFDKTGGTLRALTAKLKTQMAPFKSLGKDWSEFSKAVKPLTGAFAGVGSSMVGVGREAIALGVKIAAMAGAAGFALFSIVHGAVEAGDKLQEMADRVGVGVNFYASLQHAANLADIDQEQFASGMDRLNKGLGEMKAGSGDLLEFLNKVSPKLAEQVKGAKTTEAALSLLTDTFARLPDTQRRAALSSHVFGKTNLQMGNFLHQGSAAIQKQQKEYLRIAGSQEAFAQGASDLDNALKNLEVAFLGLRSAAMGALFPAFTMLSGIVTEFVVKNRDGIQKWATEAATAIQAWVSGGGIDRLVQGFKDFFDAVGPIVSALGGFKFVAVAVGAVLAGPLVLSVVGLVGSLATMAVVLAPFAGVLATIAAVALSVGAAFATIWENWEQLKSIWKDGANLESITRLAGILASANPLAYAGQKIGASLSGSVSTALGVAPPMGADQSRPGATSTEARVLVDFSNMPKGTRVTQDATSSQPVDLSMGYSMVH